MSLRLSEALLKLFKHKSSLKKYITIVNKRKFGTEKTKKIINLFDEYFEKNEDQEVIDPNLFSLWVESNKKMTSDEIDFWNENSKVIEEELNEAEERIIVDRLSEEVKNQELKKIVEDFENGNISNVTEIVKQKAQEFDSMSNYKFDFVRTHSDELFRSDRDDIGFKWRLNCLNQSMRPLQPGDFIIIGARPDSGKSSFIASEITNFAIQTSEPILWLNNEGINEKIKKRCFQSALNMTVNEIVALKEKGEDVDEFYSFKTNGGDDKIKIVGIHDKTSTYVENIISTVKPSIIVFDMIDNVVFSGANHLGGVRTDQILETMYQWARTLAVRFSCVVIATSQISSDGEGMKFPTKDMLKDSKTGKQGACDAILMIGRQNDSTNYRYISLPKNKLARAGARIDPRAEVYFDYSKSRYSEICMSVNSDEIEF